MKHDHTFTTREQSRGAVLRINALCRPDPRNWPAWLQWLRESQDRLDAFDRHEHEQAIARLREFQNGV